MGARKVLLLCILRLRHMLTASVLVLKNFGRCVADDAYSETLAEVHMSDSSQTVSDVFDGMAVTTVVCQDSELSMGMSTAFCS